MLKVALIGAGGVTFGKHREAYEGLAKRMKPWVVCDPSEEASKQMREWAEIPDERWVKTLDDLEAFKDEIDMAVVATPVKYHRASACRALSLGWHVLCEKPLAMNLEEVDEMVALSKEQGKCLGVMHNVYFMGDVRHSHAYVKAGNIGEVKMVTGHSSSTPWKGTEWRSDASLGGSGHYFDCLYHEIYVARSTIGSPLKRVHAVARKLGKADISVEDVMLSTFEFENGAVASFQDVKAFDEVPRSLFASYGSQGAVIREIPSEDGLYVKKGGRSFALPEDPEASDHGTTGVMERFVKAIELGEPLPYEIDACGDGRENLRVVLAAYKSATSGEPVDLKTWKAV